MESTLLIATAGFFFLLALALVAGAITLSRGVRDDLGQGRRESFEQSRHLREELGTSVKGLGDSLTGTVRTFSETQHAQLNTVGDTIAKLTEITQQNILDMRATIDNRLRQLQEDNGKKLEDMRLTVDEKLQGTLEKRLSESFKQVSDRLEKVHQGLGEMQTLTSGVGDLKRMLTNVKTRGIWGEYQLGNILEQFLSSEQYATNVAVKPRSAETVEFAVKLPGSGDDEGFIYLPIDAKFPLESYQRLVAAQEAGDVEGVQSASNELAQTIRREARRIRDKYIHENTTTPFAILFLPTESLYSEVLRQPGLAEQVQTEYRVNIAGPSTLTSLLTSLQMGFRTLAIQKRSGEIAKNLAGVRKQFEGFTTLLENVHKKLDSASKEVEKATKKSKSIERKLEKFEELPSAEPTLQLADTEECDHVFP